MKPQIRLFGYGLTVYFEFEKKSKEPRKRARNRGADGSQKGQAAAGGDVVFLKSRPIPNADLSKRDVCCRYAC